VRAELDSASKAREALRTQVRGMKGKMEYTTVEKIDEQMARLEQRLQHTSMPLTEEKKVLDDIKKLRASRVSRPGLHLVPGQLHQGQHTSATNCSGGS
jgi:uncharacterized coiled-coil DUF342 family protein